MSLNFQQVQEQVRRLGENAPQRAQHLQELRQRASDLLQHNARELAQLRAKVEDARQHDPSLRCALPLDGPSAEPLDAHFPLPPLPAQATLIAADGSQINPDRHAAVNYCLINVGAIRMRHGSSEPPLPFTQCRLLYDEQLYTATGTLTEESVALMRDLNERRYLVELAEAAAPPVITFMDGPMELWGAKDEAGESGFRKHLREYLDALLKLHGLDVTTAGYVDKPGADLVVRLLEIAQTTESALPDIRKQRPLRGVTDTDLYRDRLAAGERSAMFAIQSRSWEDYSGPLALHFFYLNVGLPDDPWLARIEVPAWVAADAHKLDNLHAVLIHQCRIMGGRPYPYLLHRAHETAVVTLDEKEQLTRMILHELQRQHVSVGRESYKQALKLTAKRRRPR
jgi:hypothetical protein